MNVFLLKWGMAEDWEMCLSFGQMIDWKVLRGRLERWKFRLLTLLIDLFPKDITYVDFQSYYYIDST